MIVRSTAVLKLVAVAVFGSALTAASHRDPPCRSVTPVTRQKTTGELLIGTWELTEQSRHALEGARRTYEFTSDGRFVGQLWSPGSPIPVPICGRYHLEGDQLRTTVNDGSALTGRVSENRMEFIGENILVLIGNDADGKPRRWPLARIVSAPSE
ncbi:unnamed protein product [Gemmataceae bacterium]|nr:unnamed protein product [Gemmataceae bacterium]VTT96697.1 unnamed protein product [Gemmataceae bacterium]